MCWNFLCGHNERNSSDSRNESRMLYNYYPKMKEYPLKKKSFCAPGDCDGYVSKKVVANLSIQRSNKINLKVMDDNLWSLSTLLSLLWHH
jgi:hypothetical protein